MHKPFFRICSLLLAVILLVNMLPMNIFAEEFQEAQAAAAAEAAMQTTDAQIVAEVVENRTEYTKQFKLDNGLFTAAVYAEPVHYLEDGQWKDIDNTLKATADGTFTNTAGVWDVILPSQLTGKSPITITKDGYTLSFQMAGELLGTGKVEAEELSLDTASQPFSVSPTKSTQGQIRAIDFSEARESAEHEAFVLEKNASQLLYADVYENTDVQYDLQGNRVKESIIIDSYSSTLRGYRYILKTDRMAPVLNEDGSIHFYDKEENIVMTMPAPYLIDANEQYNFDIQVSLEGKDGVYILTYLLPSAWLAEEERAWPVVLDPEVKADVALSNIQDHSVAQNHIYDPTCDILECGYGNMYHLQRFYVKYVDLPYLTSSDVIVSASVKIYKADNSGTRTSVVEVHKVLDTWDQSTLNWNTQPEINPLVEDFNIAGSTGFYTWNVTDLVRDWYSGENTGMVFQVDAATENTTAESWQQFYASEYGSEGYRPNLSITFRNNNGIEDSWDYATASAGRAGTGYVNTYTGNLTWIRSDLGFGGNLMPVSIAHAYNLNDSGENTYGMGYGWRTNFNQRVYEWDVDDSYYVWEDGDGTTHYFKYGSYATYYDEDSLNLTLKTNGSGDEKYSIADRQGNTTYFDTNGRMTYQENNQKTKSTITIAYTDTSGNLIDYITDGVGRKYDFTYNSDNLLSSICYYGNGETALHTVTYSYTNGMLTAVTDNDGKISSYAYKAEEKLSDGETPKTVTKYLLHTAQDIDGYKLEYAYNETEGAFQPYRVASVKESCGSITGGELNFEYAHNQTTLTDHNENVEILQFNNFGNTVCIQDDEGRAQYAKYTVNDASETGKANQLRLSSKLQNTVSNICWATSFEDANSMDKKGENPGSGSYDLTSDAAYYGSKSLEITGALTMGTGNVTIPAGETMTFSAYVKTDGATAHLTLGSTETSQTLSGTSGWTRLEVTYTNNTEADQSIYPGVVTSGSGKTYIDCIQLETNPTASRYNLVQNGDFRYGTNNWYVGDSAVEASKIVTQTPATAQLTSNVYHATGNPTGENRISQTVNVSGGEGDTFVLTGWARGDAVPTPKESNESKQRYFGIVAKFNYTESANKSKTYVAKFNPDTDSDNHWQYSAEMMVAEHDYSSITIYVAYDRSANEAWFDGIQLFKEEFGQSYTYDTEGNVIAVKDLQKDTTEYTYDSKGNVLTAKRDGDEIMTYTYDSYSNVLTSESAKGLKQEYEYDDYGNNLTVSVVDPDSSKKITTTYGYANEGNTLGYTTDSLGRTTYYYYNADTNVLEWTLYPEDLNAYENNNQVDTKTYCSYDNMGRMTGTAARVDTGTTLFANYFYENDYLKYIQTASTIYTFNNNAFGLRSEVKAGNHILASYNYTDDQNFYLDSLDYGNGDKVQYKYDDKGRMLSQTYEDGETVTYHYDNYGALASVTDSTPDATTGSTTKRTTTYYYDFTDRLMKYEEKDAGTYRHTFSYEYDDENHLTKTVDTHYGVDFVYTYTYDDDDRTSAIAMNDSAREYTYDNYGRTSQQVTKHTNKTVDSEGKETETKVQVKKDTYTFTGTENATSSQIATHTISYGSAGGTVYSYTYDDNGNITSISDGTNTITYEYDTANQLTKEINPAGGYVHTWTYNNAGNIQERKEYKYANNAQGELTATVTYDYNDAEGWGDLLTGLTIVTTNEDETDTVQRSLAYDGIGNPESDGVRSYTWEHGRQLASLTMDGVTWNYTYNSDGLRTVRTSNSKHYSYVYNGDKLAYMTAGDKHMYFAYDANGTPMSIVYSGTVYYYVTNVQGDVIALVDTNGNQVVTYSYDAWGNPLSMDGDLKETLGKDNPLRYRSYVYDTETKLYYLQSRYYNPEIGRFINADALVSTGQGSLGNNVFAYCLNNPTNRVDLTGHLSTKLVKVVVKGLIEGIISASCTYLTGGTLQDTVLAFVEGLISGALSELFSGVDVMIAIVTTFKVVGDCISAGASIGDSLFAGGVHLLCSLIGPDSCESIIDLGLKLGFSLLSSRVSSGIEYNANNDVIIEFVPNDAVKHQSSHTSPLDPGPGYVPNYRGYGWIPYDHMRRGDYRIPKPHPGWSF